MQRNLKTVSQFASSSVWSEPSLRWMIFRSADNGLDEAGAIVRIGRRVYIDAEGFDRWIEAQNPGLRPVERHAQAGGR